MSWWSRGTWPRQQSSRVLRGVAACGAGGGRGYGIKNACLCQAHTRLSCPARNRRCWRPGPGRSAASTGTGCGRRSCWPRRPAGPTPRSPGSWGCAPTRSASGAAGSRPAGWPGWPMPRAAGARGCSPLRTGPRSSRWPARCRPSPGCRCRGGAARTWPANWPPAASSRSRRPRSAGGWPAMPSSPGSTGPGSPSATRSSPPGRPGCWTCTPGPGTAGRWAPMTT